MFDQVSRQDGTNGRSDPEGRHAERHGKTAAMHRKEAIQNGDEGGLHEPGADALQNLKTDQ